MTCRAEYRAELTELADEIDRLRAELERAHLAQNESQVWAEEWRRSTVKADAAIARVRELCRLQDDNHDNSAAWMAEDVLDAPEGTDQ